MKYLIVLFLFIGTEALACSSVIPDDSLSIHEKVNLLITCPTDTVVSVSWENPAGQLIQTKTDNVKNQSIFWFKLIQKGRFSRMFTNNDFSREHYGQWIARITFPDNTVKTHTFSLN